ncbi:MAG: phosphatidate cytidylyltransferase [Flavisolibacter sp.]
MQKNYLIGLLALITVTLSSCEAIGSIFKAGMWFGIIIVAAVVILIIWLIGRSRR